MLWDEKKDWTFRQEQDLGGADLRFYVEESEQAVDREAGLDAATRHLVATRPAPGPGSAVTVQIDAVGLGLVRSAVYDYAVKWVDSGTERTLEEGTLTVLPPKIETS